VANAAQIIARRLHQAGCRHAFGIPGGEVLTLIDALNETGIDFRLARHENGAGFMAEGSYHATGAPGILVATVGPGVANAVNVVANAWQDRVPLIFLTGCVDAADAAGYTHQVLDHGALVRTVTKASFTLVDGAVDLLVDKALAIAQDGQPGPVHLDLPIGLAGAQQTGNSSLRRARPAPVAPAPGPDLEAARALLAEAERPIMLAGLDLLHQAEAAATAARFAEDFGIPVITTYKAKGVLDEDHPLSLGAAAISPLADSHLMPLVRQSDCIVLAGYDPIEMRAGWRDPWDGAAPVVEFAAVANTHYVHQARHSFIGHVGAGLDALGGGIAPRQTWPGGEPAKVRAALAQAFRAEPEWGPAVIMETICQALPEDGVATVDTGAHRILFNHVWRCRAPGRLLQSMGLCTMGCALPLAAGYKLAQPSRPVVAFTGDGGLEMVAGELASLRDLDLPVIIVVFVDDSLSLIEQKQRARGLERVAVDFGSTDFPALAQAFGGVGVTASSRETLAQAFAAALERKPFTLIACPIDVRDYDGRF
jgi:acetolactate synthase-1/2/3 large subunit